MLTKEQRTVISEYVNPDYYDIDKLTRYLEMHDVVGNEVFQYCDKHKEGRDVPTYSTWLDDEGGYQPLPVDKFVRRVPFYFYTRDLEKVDHNNMGTLHYLYSASYSRKNESEHSIEEIFEILEYTFYDLKLPLVHIFSYWINQTGMLSGDSFFQWYKYLKMREGDPDVDFFPDRFITAYNETLEENGQDPIIYEMDEMFPGEYFFRNGTQIEFDGQFPCDKDGRPILKWIGIRAKNIGSIKCNCEKSKRGRLTITITPNSVIHLLNVYNGNDDDDTWYQIYAGPLCMEFDFPVLKEKRKQQKFTQQEVADAIGATVRTYQKWENGETTPDGHYLLRLMNWLDIPDVQYAIKYTDV